MRRIDGMADGDYILFEGDTHVERDDMVEFQPTFIVNDYIMSNRSEVIAIVCRGVFEQNVQ